MGSVFFVLTALFTLATSQTQPSCDSKVYCQGHLLHTVQMARLFGDGKFFVDMRMLNDEGTTLRNFEEFMDLTNNNPTSDDVNKFVSENFVEGNEFEDWTPMDYTDNPEILSRIEDTTVKDFASELVKIWPQLARKVKQEVLDNPDLYTLLPVEHGFIVPGGRFREFYYWDSYWIIKGLLLSDMYETVRGMLDNFISIVDKHGFLPNGARIYYLNRSQPPLLNAMVADYIKATDDIAWLQNNIKILDKEVRFWLENRLITVTKNGRDYTLAHYGSESGSPRPESYYEDYNTASYFENEEDKVQMWADLKSGAESGWDFSSRWIVDKNRGNTGNLTNLKVRRIIPVDLNSFLCQAFHRLAEFYILIGDYQNALIWFRQANLWRRNINEVFYNIEDGIWYDFDSELGQHRKYFFPSNFAPLWAEAYDSMDADKLGQRAAEYLQNQTILEFQGGIPASLSGTGEQWDFPNAWPPLQSIVITGLDKTGNCEAKNKAKELAQRWITANMIGYNQTDEMFEKYDAVNPGQYGGGGEYTVQSGFGWTNGVVLEFIERFFTTKNNEDVLLLNACRRPSTCKRQNYMEFLSTFFNRYENFRTFQYL